MFKTRLISGIVLILISLVTLIAGGDVLFFTLLAVSLVGMSELYKIAKVEKKFLGIAGYVLAIVYYILLRFQLKEWLFMWVILSVMVLMSTYVLTYPTYHADQVMMTFFGLFYVAVMLSYIYQTRLLPNGKYTVWLVFICSWGCDTCAYCVGVLLGKHKMAPKLSPKKSIEGAVGGLLGAGLIGAIYALCISRFAAVPVVVWHYVQIGVIGGAIAMIGDLAASAIKRNHQIKDYGNLIPGHGGILDRFDSVIFTAPAIYYMAVLLMR